MQYTPLLRARAEAAHWVRRLQGKVSPAASSAQRLAQEVREIMRTAPPFTPAPDAKRIAVIAGHGLNALSLSYDALWLMSLRLRGHHTAAVYCDEGLPSCEFNFRGAGLDLPGRFRGGYSPDAVGRTCWECSLGASTALRETCADMLTLAQFGKPGEVEDILALTSKIAADEIRGYVHMGISVGEHAFSSTLRCTLRGFVAHEDPDELFIYRRQLASSILMVERFNRFIDFYRPDKVVGVHGVYLMHGTMADVARERGVGVDIFGVPYRKGTILFSHNETYHRSLVTEAHDLWENETLDASREEMLLEYLSSKKSGGRDNVNYHPNPVLENDEIVSALGIDPEKPVISMFTNVIWDAQIYYSFNAFDTIFDWVFSTIEYFRAHPELQLVIRVHPAEATGGFITRQPIVPEIMARFPDLPKNVFIVPPESGLSSYTIAEMSKAALIYGTKMGLEIAYRGIPVIVAGETFNRSKGYTYDVETREEYFSLLDRAKDLPKNSPEMIRKALRYAYYFFYQKMMDFTLIEENPYRSHREAHEKFYTFSNASMLLPGREQTLDVICEGILHETPFVARF